MGWVGLGLLLVGSLVIGCGGGGGDSDGTANNPTAGAPVVIGGTPINSVPPAQTTKTGTPVISNLVLNPNTARAGDRVTFSLAFTDANADVNTFGIQFNGESKYYSYDVSGIASGNLAFNLTVQDTIGNVQPGSYQIVVFLIDKLANVSNYLTGTLTIQGNSPPPPPTTTTTTVPPTPTVNVTGTWVGVNSINPGNIGTLQLTQAANGSVTGTFVLPTTVDTGQVTGSVSGNQVTLTIKWPVDTGWINATVSSDGKTMTGTWTATSGPSGTITATRQQ